MYKRQIIAQAKANGWSRVPDEVTEPGTIEPPCFLPVSYTHLDVYKRQEVWFAVARGAGEDACITVECMADGNACLDACTEAVLSLIHI